MPAGAAAVLGEGDARSGWVLPSFQPKSGLQRRRQGKQAEAAEGASTRVVSTDHGTDQAALGKHGT